MDNHLKRKRQSSSDDEVGGDGNQTSRARTSITHPPDGETYEVFLSFRGKDTRKKFTDHLYKGLVNVGVRVFRDNEALRVGEEIGPELDQAIKASTISIPIISPNYASSKWCLRELVHILECKKTARQVVLPIFYRVDPSSVRHQIGTFETAFRSHNSKYGSNSLDVQKWRSALTEVASLKGWESSKISDGHEAELVEIVVTTVLNELKKATLDVTDCLVGIEDRKTEILKMVEGKETRDAQAIVIHGMGGIGKTTLAKVVYNQLSTKFNYCTFLPDIREKLAEQKRRPEDLQKQLISGILRQQWSREISHVDEGINTIKDRLKQKEVLILFDDVNHSDQLNALARERSWFKSGSILIITTRNKDVLKTWGEGRLTYELNGLDPSLSFLLFCRHAFRRDKCPSVEFHDIAKKIVSTTGGLPLAIEVIGSMLLGEPKVKWEGVFEELKFIPHEDVQKKLRISYDALEHRHKQIFLDIACLSIQNSINFAFYMWDDCRFFPKAGKEKLISLSLIKMGEENEVIIHDQLRDLGRAIVREEDNIELGNRSRLWDEEALEVMQSNQGTAKIYALNLSLDYEVNLTSEPFKDMRKLRFLGLRNAKLVGDFKNLLLDRRWLRWAPIVSLPTNFGPTKLLVLDSSFTHVTKQWDGWAQVEGTAKIQALNLSLDYSVPEEDRNFTSEQFKGMRKLRFLNMRNANLVGDFKNLLLDLRWLQSEGGGAFPSDSLLTNFRPTKLVVLDLSRSTVTEQWEGWAQVELVKNLKVLNLDWCPKLTSTPDFSAFEKLEILIVRSCWALRRIHPSIRNLNKTLLTLDVSSCRSLEELPNEMGEMEELRQLLVDLTRIRTIPMSIGYMTKLENLSANGCHHLQHLPDSIGSLINLVSLSLDDCTNFQHLPDSIGSLINLNSLSLYECSQLQHLPDSIGSLINFNSLSLGGCTSLQHLPGSIGSLINLVSLSLDDCTSLQHLPDSIGSLINFNSLSFDGCTSLQYLPDSIGSLINLVSLSLDGCTNLQHLPDSIGSLINLNSLSLYGCSQLQHLPDSIGSLINFNSLSLGGCTSLQHLPGSIGSLINLVSLSLYGCSQLQYLPDSIGSLINLVSLSLASCTSLQHLPDSIGSLINLNSLSLYRCSQLQHLPDSIGSLINLVSLSLDGCTSLQHLPDSIGSLINLNSLSLYGCSQLQHLPDSIGSLINFNSLSLGGCTSLQHLPGSIGSLINLVSLSLYGCSQLQYLPDSIGSLINLVSLSLVGCTSLQHLSDSIGSLINLNSLSLYGCSQLQHLPDSIGLLTNLDSLSLADCQYLR